jgi:hypothetical protein
LVLRREHVIDDAADQLEQRLPPSLALHDPIAIGGLEVARIVPESPGCETVLVVGIRSSTAKPPRHSLELTSAEMVSRDAWAEDPWDYD